VGCPLSPTPLPQGERGSRARQASDGQADAPAPSPAWSLAGRSPRSSTGPLGSGGRWLKSPMGWPQGCGQGFRQAMEGLSKTPASARGPPVQGCTGGADAGWPFSWLLLFGHTKRSDSGGPKDRPKALDLDLVLALASNNKSTQSKRRGVQASDQDPTYAGWTTRRAERPRDKSAPAADCGSATCHATKRNAAQEPSHARVGSRSDLRRLGGAVERKARRRAASQATPQGGASYGRCTCERVHAPNASPPRVNRTPRPSGSLPPTRRPADRGATTHPQGNRPAPTLSGTVVPKLTGSGSAL
jgi:hypothetical protein